MNWTTTLPFILDGIDGNFRIEYNPFGQKFYHNGVLIKKKGFGFSEAKYRIATKNGGYEIVKVKGDSIQGHKIEFRGKTIRLEKLGKEVLFALSFIPVSAIIMASLTIFRNGFGIGGGFVFGFSLAVGMMTTFMLTRNEKRISKQILFSIACAIGSVILMILTSLIFGLIFGGELIIAGHTIF